MGRHFFSTRSQYARQLEKQHYHKVIQSRDRHPAVQPEVQMLDCAQRAAGEEVEKRMNAFLDERLTREARVMRDR